jgi:hypothetical protein
MAETLTEFLKNNRCDGFTPGVHHSADGDCVSYFVKNDRCIAERVDDLVTVYRSVESNELVGCKIKGVQRILRTLGDFGVTVEDREIGLGIFFIAAAVANPPQKSKYKEIGLAMRNARLKTRELQPA